MNAKISGEYFRRTEMLVGETAMRSIAESKIIIFGCGGVGSWAAEALVRSGVRRLTVVDCDVVSPTNINRQAVATSSTIGRSKVEVMREILLDINLDAEIVAIDKAFSAATADEFGLSSFDFIIDAIDSLKHKAELIIRATRTDATLISSMGAALRLDPMKVRHAEFWNVKGCRLAATLRRRFKRDDVFPEKKFLCVYSEELPIETPESRAESSDQIAGSRHMRDNGSSVFVTATFGITIASLVIRSISEHNNQSL